MIQPNEIRIGNYVYLQKSNTFYQITEITQSEVEDGRYEATGVSDDSIFHTFTDNINPIPLTEDVLLKCKGVVKERKDDKYGRVYLISNTKYIIRIVNFGNQLKEDFGFSLEISDEKDWCSIKRIYTLHDFQNTIYSLTNQELEIEL